TRGRAPGHTDTMDDLLADAAARGRRYVRQIDDRAVAPLPAAVADLAKFDEPLPDGPGDPMATLAMLDEVGTPATVASTGPRYFGFVAGGTLPVAMAAGWLGMAWDQNCALPVMSPVATRLHTVTNRWLVDLVGLPGTSQVVYVTGATMANVTALIAARDR